MKTQVNFTTSPDDVSRFADTADFERFLSENGFSGVELMVVGEGEQGLVAPKHVVGLHMSSFFTWIDLWEQNEEGLLREFGTLDAAEAFYGGLTRGALVSRFKRDLENAHRFGVEYVVFHVSDIGSEEFFALTSHRTDEEIARATAELLGQVFAGEDGQVALLLENLWHPGLTFTRPEIASYLLDAVPYGNTGFMFDTGHAFHTNWDIATQAEGIRYIHGLLDGLDARGIAGAIRGVHLNQSITGAYARAVAAAPPVLSSDTNERLFQNFTHAFKIDRHEPFSCPEAAGLVRRIAPDYLTFELITESRAQLERAVATQRCALSGQPA